MHILFHALEAVQSSFQTLAPLRTNLYLAIGDVEGNCGCHPLGSFAELRPHPVRTISCFWLECEEAAVVLIVLAGAVVAVIAPCWQRWPNLNLMLSFMAPRGQ
eukprot:6035018-Amphidinium_carterae.1